MNHTHEVEIPGASLDASIILRQVLASLIAGVTTEVSQTNDVQQISVNVISMDTGLKFSFVLPSVHAVAEAMIADIVMSDESPYPVQNRVIKAYVDGKFWTGTAAEYVLLEDDMDIICFLSDTNVIMFNGESYSLSTHVHGNITYGGAIGAVAGAVVITGEGGVLETITVEGLKELLGASSGMNLLHNAEFASPFNTKALTIYNTVAECLDRWSLLGGTLTVNNDYVTLSQASINTAQMRQTLPVGTYDRLMGQTLTLSVLLAEDETVYKGTGVIDGVATTIITFALDNGYLARLIVNNGARTAYVEIIGGTRVGAIDLLRAKFEIGSFPSIEDGVTDAAFDLARVRAHDLSGAMRLDPLSVGLAHVSRHFIGGADALNALPYDAVSSNLLINGGFSVNQLVKSGTVTLSAGSYGHDMWKAGASGCTYTFATSENVTTLTISAGSLIQVVEGLNLQSGTVCLSWAGTAQGKIGAGSYSASGVTGTATGGTNLNIEFNTGTLSKVQLNYGAVTLPFVPRSFADELRLCQRYYEKSYNQSVAPATVSALGQQSRIISTGYFTCDTSIVFSVIKRIAPTVTIYSPQNGASAYAEEVNIGSVFVANRAVAVGSIGERAASFQSNDGAFIVGNVLRLQWVADAEL